MTESGITIVQVARAMGIEMSPTVAWSVGATVRDLYIDEFGCLPEKRLRMKSSGMGSHCFAIYPASWRERIERVIRTVASFDRSQGKLFDE